MSGPKRQTSDPRGAHTSHSGTWLIARSPKHFLAGHGRTLYNALLVKGSSFWALLPSFPTKTSSYATYPAALRVHVPLFFVLGAPKSLYRRYVKAQVFSV